MDILRQLREKDMSFSEEKQLSGLKVFNRDFLNPLPISSEYCMFEEDELFPPGCISKSCKNNKQYFRVPKYESM